MAFSHCKPPLPLIVVIQQLFTSFASVVLGVLFHHARPNTSPAVVFLIAVFHLLETAAYVLYLLFLFTLRILEFFFLQNSPADSAFNQHFAFTCSVHVRFRFPLVIPELPPEVHILWLYFRLPGHHEIELFPFDNGLPIRCEYCGGNTPELLLLSAARQLFLVRHWGLHDEVERDAKRAFEDTTLQILKTRNSVP